MSKYIVKNCPCFIDFDEQSLFENLCKNGGNCKECTDCVLKQIVEKCKYWQNRWTDDIDEREGFDQIIELLDIQEIE